MWCVKSEFDESGEHATSVVPLDAILHAAHLVGMMGENFLPIDLKHMDCLTIMHMRLCSSIQCTCKNHNTVTLKTVPMFGHPEQIDHSHDGEILHN